MVEELKEKKSQWWNPIARHGFWWYAIWFLIVCPLVRLIYHFISGLLAD